MSKCQEEDCPDEGHPVTVHVNTYSDHTKRTRRRLTLQVILCPRHQYVHGYAWTRVPYPLPYYGAFPADYARFVKGERAS